MATPLTYWSAASSLFYVLMFRSEIVMVWEQTFHKVLPWRIIFLECRGFDNCKLFIELFIETK